jgi:hypothetical protein
MNIFYLGYLLKKWLLKTICDIFYNQENNTTSLTNTWKGSLVGSEKDLFIIEFLTTARDGCMRCRRIRVAADWRCRRENYFRDGADSLKKTKFVVTFMISFSFSRSLLCLTND